MLPDLAISGAEAWLILLAPYALLALAFVLVQFARGITGRDQTETRVVAGVAQQGRDPGAVKAAQGRLERTVATGMHRDYGGADASAGGADVKGFAPPFTFTPGRLVSTSERAERGQSDVPDVAELESEARVSDLEAIEAEIRDALRAKDQAALGELYLRHGAALRVKGETRKAGDVVRKSVMIAMQLKDARLHALGRIELGDIASDLGDLTTACEHWQMAKRMFLEIKHRSDTDAADKRMLSHGCPTEWVLNDF